jgi:predicted RecB family nuclease
MCLHHQHQLRSVRCSMLREATWKLKMTGKIKSIKFHVHHVHYPSQSLIFFFTKKSLSKQNSSPADNLKRHEIKTCFHWNGCNYLKI